jgi:hypothetical protein
MKEESQTQLRDEQDEGLFSKLTEFFNTDEILEIYTNVSDPEKFSSGFVCAISDMELLLCHIHPSGLYDGYMVKEISSIYRLNYNTKYCGKLRKLWTINGRKHHEVAQVSTNQYLNLLYHALNNRLVVSVELLDSSFSNIIGLVKRIEGESITFEEYDEYGEFDGVSIICLKDITHLVCDSEDESCLKLLIESNDV